MSQPQKNETLVLVAALLITLGLVGGGVWWFMNRTGVDLGSSTNTTQENPSATALRISFGEKTLIPGEVPSAKRDGVAAIAAGDFNKAATSLAAILKENRNDPEALIFLNNARIGKQSSYTIAASVPIGSEPNTSLEILRGVAQAQNEVNSSGGIKGVPLKVAIANDDNNSQIAQQIASALVSNSNILGVVGPYASDVTLAAGTVYNSGQLVAISPTSSAIKLSGFSRYVFRTVPSDYVAARALANQMLTKLRQKNVAVFFNSQSAYSQSLKSEFETAILLGGGQVTSEFDLSNSDFSAARSVEQAIKQGVQVLLLAPNGSVLDKALQIVQVNQKRLNLLGGDDVYTLKTLEVGGSQAVGIVVAVPWHIDGDPNSAFPRQSRQLWGADVNWRTALAYNATRALIAALERNPTRIGVQQALSSPDFSTTGASGTIRFSPSGDSNAPVQLVRIVPGSRSGTGFDFVPVRQ